VTEDELRQIVRETVARHLGVDSPVPASAGARPCHAVVPGQLPMPDWRRHPSHLRLVLPSGRDQDGPCMVEPAVGCSHCGFCQSWGH
jgi:hypothetical protein